MCNCAKTTHTHTHIVGLHAPSSQLDSLITFRLREPVISSFSIWLKPDFNPVNNPAAAAGVQCVLRRMNPGQERWKSELSHISSTRSLLSAGLNGKPVCMVNDDWYGFTPLCPHPLIKSQVCVSGSRSSAFLTPEIGSDRSGPRAGTDNAVLHTHLCVCVHKEQTCT